MARKDFLKHKFFLEVLRHLIKMSQFSQSNPALQPIMDEHLQDNLTGILDDNDVYYAELETSLADITNVLDVNKRNGDSQIQVFATKSFPIGSPNRFFNSTSPKRAWPDDKISPIRAAFHSTPTNQLNKENISPNNTGKNIHG